MAVDLSNWRDPEHVQWSFKNVNKVFNTASISKGSKASALPSKLKKFEGFKIQQQALGKPDLNLLEFLQETETDGLIVLKDENVVYEYYGRDNDKDSVHIMMSMTKSVTGLVCGILAERGQLDVNAPISKYVPEVKGTPYEKLLVQQCLDMRAGIKYDDTNPDYRNAAGWGPTEDGKPKDLHEFISSFRAPALPEVDGLGTSQFEYISVNTDLMGWVLERASGKKFPELVSELIWQPVGAESDAYITLDHAGNARPAGGMCATLRDIARIGRLVLRDGDGILPSSWIGDMLNKGSNEAFAAGPWSGFERSLGKIAYRSYWLANSENEFLMGLGVHGQMLIADRKNGIVMAKTSSQPERFDAGKMFRAVLAFKEFQHLLVVGETNGHLDS